MDASHILKLKIFSYLLFLLFPTPIRAAALPKRIQDVCRQTVNPTFCIHTFESDPRSASAKDGKTIAKIALGLAVKNAKDTQSYINDLLGDKDAKPELKAALKECANWYVGVWGSFHSAYGEVEIDDAETANYDSKIAGDDAVYCDKALASRGVVDKSLSDKNKVATYFSSIAVTVTDILD